MNEILFKMEVTWYLGWVKVKVASIRASFNRVTRWQYCHLVRILCHVVCGNFENYVAVVDKMFQQNVKLGELLNL